MCLEDAAGPDGARCSGEPSHYVCSECLEGHVRRELQKLREDSAAVAGHSAQLGRIRCVCYGAAPGRPGCAAVYPGAALARVLPAAAFEAYHAARCDLVEHLHLKAVRSLFDRQITALQRRVAETDPELLAAAVRRLMPCAKQCPKCGFGPVDHWGCPDLGAHHGRSVSGGVYISNACPRCHWWTSLIEDWDDWDGRIDLPDPARSASPGPAARAPDDENAASSSATGP